MQNNELTSIGYIKELLAKHGFRFSKKYGQNFIVNPSVCPRIADEAGIGEGYGVLEIGPGIGVLTAELAKCAEKVVAVEIDESLKPILAETLADASNVKIVWTDVLSLDLHALIQEEFGDMPVVVCANLPYYITSPVLMKLLEERIPVEHITVMVQKEAAERLLATPQSRQVGAITLAVQYYAEGEKLFDVQPGSFIPAPKVVSCVMRLTPRKEVAVHPQSEKNMFAVIKAAFSQRRKTAVNAISAGLKLPKEQVQQAVEQIGLAPMVRPEKMALQEFADLTDILFAD